MPFALDLAGLVNSTNVSPEGWGWITIDCIPRTQFCSDASISLVAILEFSKFVGDNKIRGRVEEEEYIWSKFALYL